MKSSVTLRALATIASLLLMVGNTAAQDNPELGDIDPEAGDEGGGMEAGGSATWSAPTGGSSSGYATPAAGGGGGGGVVEDETPPGDTDHSQHVGRFGVGYFGVMELPTCIPTLDPMTGILLGACGAGSIDAPTIGARYWLDSEMGIEAALGIHVSSGERKVTNTPPMMMASSVTIEEPAYTGVGLHVGAVLVFADTKHVTFEVVPQLNFGIVSGTQKQPPNAMMSQPDIDVSGMMVELGGTIGAEVHFGFIDLPSLALQGNVGLRLRYTSTSAEVGNIRKIEASSLNVETGVGSSPWEIFTGGVTAIYYL